jgi:ATP-dependent DNA helicase RecG
MTSSSASSVAQKRLHILKESSDGFLIAEKDLEIRGPGDMSGTAQSGLPKFKLASIVDDADLLSEAKKIARSILETDPYLDKKSHKALKDYLDFLQDDGKNMSTIA